MSPAEQEAALKRVFAELDEVKAELAEEKRLFDALVRSSAAVDFTVRSQRDRLRAALVQVEDVLTIIGRDVRAALKEST